MRPPHPRLATHLIAVAPVDNSGRDDDFAYTSEYPGETAYLGVVERGSMVEKDSDIVYSEDVFAVAVFAATDPGLLSQARVRWGPVPAGFARPAQGSAGVVTLPNGWVAEKTGVLSADGAAMGPGCWAATAMAVA